MVVVGRPRFTRQRRRGTAPVAVLLGATPGPRTRIKHQRGEEVLAAHVAAPGLLCNHGGTPHRLTGLG